MEQKEGLVEVVVNIIINNTQIVDFQKFGSNYLIIDSQGYLFCFDQDSNELYSIKGNNFTSLYIIDD